MIEITQSVPNEQLGMYKYAALTTGGDIKYVLGFPEDANRTIKIVFYESESYVRFHQYITRMTTPIVEIDGRGWWNRLKRFLRKCI